MGSTRTERALLTDATASEAEEGYVRRLGLEEQHPVSAKIQKANRLYLAVGLLLGSALAAAVIYTTIPRRSILSAGTASTFAEDFAMPKTVKEYKKFKLPLPRPDECSLATIQNCATSECCDNFGFQCYMKNATYGTCTCKPVGFRNRGANLTEDCAPYGKCADDNRQCYKQSDGAAKCQVTCGSPEDSCEAIGPRNTRHYKDDAYKGYMTMAPPIKTCSHVGEDCSDTKCCRWSGYNCYEKNATFASCLKSCIPQKPNGGVSNLMQFQPGAPEDDPPKHWVPYFEEAGPGPWTCKPITTPLTKAFNRGTSLYCFTVALSDNGGKKKLHELELVKTAQKAYAGVFACDKWSVFSDVEEDLNPGSTIKVAYTKVLTPNGTAVRRPNTKIYVNSLLFGNVWRYIKKETSWSSFSWVVKADPSTVFIPARLRTILSTQMVTEAGVYIENCKFVRMSLHGSMEVVSKDAFGTFLDNLDDCYETLPWKNGSAAHWRYYGEDKFMQFCMDKHGITRVPSRQMVESVPSGENINGLHLTISCPGHRTKFQTNVMKWKPNCSRSVTAGLHPYKTPKEWLECLKNTTEIEESKKTWPFLTSS